MARRARRRGTEYGMSYKRTLKKRRSMNDRGT